VELDEILQVDAVIVTHTHLDHWDEAAKRLVPKELPVFAQNAKDAEAIRAEGFADVRILADDTYFDDVTLSKTPGQHGSNAAMAAIRQILGDVCGVIFKHPNEKTLCLTGTRFGITSLKTLSRSTRPTSFW
jgi:L-ascorbate metabolism protein UlaG (beta-lactamase superfamily)